MPRRPQIYIHVVSFLMLIGLAVGVVGGAGIE